MQDAYEFEYDCQVEFPEDPEVDTIHSTIEISVSVDPYDSEKYDVDLYLNNPPGHDISAVTDDMFEQVESRMLAELAVDGITRDMLTYP